MTRIGLFLLILSFAGAAHATKRDACQLDLFSGPPREAPPKVPEKFTRISDLTVMQKKLWELRAEGKRDAYDFLKNKLQNQLALTRRNDFAAHLGRHKLYKATDVSFALLRDKQWGHPELVAYELNEELGGPLRIPVTVSQIDGVMQLWFGYRPEDRVYTDAEAQDLSQKIDDDADLYLFTYLTANVDMRPQNIVMDRDFGAVVFDFGNGFYLQPDIDVEKMRDMMAKTKFDWRKALNRMDEQKIVDLAASRLAKARARALQERICVLRTLFNGGENFFTCAIP